MKNIILQLIQTYIAILSVIFPKKASKKAQDIFFTPRKYASKPWEIANAESAKSKILEGGIHCLVWGNDEGEPILLVHGWEGRATQMSVFLPYLASKYKLIAINAPAHGLSEGIKSHPHKFIKAIFTAQEHFGSFHAIIGHSMGGGCAVYAALEQLKVKKVVSIAGPANFESVVNAFAQFIGLKGKALHTFMADTEVEVQLPFPKINLAARVKNLSQSLLVIHDKHDKEIPFTEGSRYKTQINNGEFFSTQGLGHRKIMQSEHVLRKVADFIG
jgi:pimeloyl-ACP methyl ester carboxylesterase